MNAPKIGLLPLYVQLYDEILPELCADLEPFRARVATAFREHGIQVVEAPVCKVKADFEEAVERLEYAGVDLIVTLHLAYSPSLESAEVLSRTDLPILMLDTTPDKDFGPEVDPQRLLNNHGIHGLQDLASMLRRNGKVYSVIAGHLGNPRTLERACAVIRDTAAPSPMHGMRVLRIGKPFEGMGDFQVDEAILRDRLGIQVDTIAPNALLESVQQVTEDAIEREMAWDLEGYAAEIDPAVHQRSVRLGLGLRAYLEHGQYDAISMNFLAFDIESGPLSTVPFLECSKAMARGLGYAGEGDVITAALVAALNNTIGPTTFTEMFCPDWAGGSIFLSHMGEFNPDVAAEKPRLYEKDFPFTPTQNPAALACAPRAGAATLINLAPGPNNSFSLIIAPVEVLGDGTHPDYKDWIRGWIKPERPLNRFLEHYSQHGGTHHCALVMQPCRDAALAFTRAVGIEAIVLDA